MLPKRSHSAYTNLVSQAIHQPGNHKLEFNVGQLPDGAYTIRLSDEEGILTKPLIVSE